MRGCVFAGGNLRDSGIAREVAARSDFVIAADGGAQHLAAIGLQPQIIVGDMDSIDGDLWEKDETVRRVVWPREKDKTDTELAVEVAFEQGCEEVTVLAAAGGRLDHTLGNVALIARYPRRVVILDGASTLLAINRLNPCRLTGPPGTIVSLIPYGTRVMRVRTAGLRYPLEGQDLVAGTRGISNQLSEATARVEIEDGILLVYLECGEVT